MHTFENVRQTVEGFEVLAGHALDAVESYGKPGGEQKLKVAKRHLTDLINSTARYAAYLEELEVDACQ